MKRLLILLTVVVAGALIASPALASNTITVGEDESIQTAIDNAQAGDVIQLEGDTYTENIVIDKDVEIVGPATIEPDGDTSLMIDVQSNVSLVDLDLQTANGTLIDSQGQDIEFVDSTLEVTDEGEYLVEGEYGSLIFDGAVTHDSVTVGDIDGDLIVKNREHNGAGLIEHTGINITGDLVVKNNYYNGTGDGQSILIEDLGDNSNVGGDFVFSQNEYKDGSTRIVFDRDSFTIGGDVVVTSNEISSIGLGIDHNSGGTVDGDLIFSDNSFEDYGGEDVFDWGDMELGNIVMEDNVFVEGGGNHIFDAGVVNSDDVIIESNTFDEVGGVFNFWHGGEFGTMSIQHNEYLNMSGTSRYIIGIWDVAEFEGDIIYSNNTHEGQGEWMSFFSTWDWTEMNNNSIFIQDNEFEDYVYHTIEFWDGFENATKVEFNRNEFIPAPDAVSWAQASYFWNEAPNSFEKVNIKNNKLLTNEISNIHGDTIDTEIISWEGTSNINVTEMNIVNNYVGDSSTIATIQTDIGTLKVRGNNITANHGLNLGGDNVEDIIMKHNDITIEDRSPEDEMYLLNDYDHYGVKDNVDYLNVSNVTIEENNINLGEGEYLNGEGIDNLVVQNNHWETYPESATFGTSPIDTEYDSITYYTENVHINFWGQGGDYDVRTNVEDAIAEVDINAESGELEIDLVGLEPSTTIYVVESGEVIEEIETTENGELYFTHNEWSEYTFEFTTEEPEDGSDDNGSDDGGSDDPAGGGSDSGLPLIPLAVGLLLVIVAAIYFVRYGSEESYI